MEPWEIEARECIRDTVTRYNSNGDTGRFEEVMKLFTEDAVMQTPDRDYTGLAEILTIFTDATERVAPDDAGVPSYVRHNTATHQIDFASETTALGRCYFSVNTRIGLDHWGRYIDEYRKVGEKWLFSKRRVTVEGRADNAVFATD